MQSADVVEERLPGGRILFFLFSGQYSLQDYQCRCIE